MMRTRVIAFTVCAVAVFLGCMRSSPPLRLDGEIQMRQQPDPATEPTFAYVIGPAPVGCPNWYVALKKAHEIAGCDASGRGDPANACQKKLKKCSACDVCPIIQPGQGPEVTIRRMHEDRRGLTSIDLKYVDFNAEICSKFDMMNLLVNTIIHESIHACPSVGGGKIHDLSPSTSRLGPPLVPLSPDGCTTYDITEACMDQ